MNPAAWTVLITAEEIRRKNRELADAIRRTYQGEELVLVSVLKGSVVFLVDLMRELDLDVEIGFLYLSSYQGETSPQTQVRHYILPFPVIENRHVLIVEDILDTGASLAFAWNHCLRQNPRSLKTCVLLTKQGSTTPGVPAVDFSGFVIPRRFVIGYGLDFKEKYRQLPYIAVLNEYPEKDESINRRMGFQPTPEIG